MLLLALTSGGAALSAEVYPAPLAALFCLLLGAAGTLPLRLPVRRALPGALSAGLAAMIALAIGRLVASALRMDPGTEPAAAWAGTAAGAALLAGCSLLALWTARALSRPPVDWAASPPQRTIGGEPVILRREAGREHTEWELGRAADYRRPLTLCLLGLDSPGDGAQALDASELETRMGRIDQLLLRELGRFEVAAEQGAAERLLILPEVWADGYAETAGQLCARAGGRMGLTVRAALLTFPFDGTRADGLITDLELALERCRAGDTVVSVGTVGRGPSGVEDFAS
jgi:hypothetical protein